MTKLYSTRTRTPRKRRVRRWKDAALFGGGIFGLIIGVLLWVVFAVVCTAAPWIIVLYVAHRMGAF